MAASNFTQFLKGLPIPWLFGGAVGQLDAGAQGAVYDSTVSRLKEAGRATFPDYGPSDAYPYMGSNRQIVQGRNESATSFKTRLKDWNQYKRFGTFPGVLEQLYYSCGFGVGQLILKQQNGPTWYLAGTPTPGQDPVTDGSIVGAYTSANALSVALHSDVTLTRSIPTSTQWWTQDSNTDLCSRWWLLVPSAANTIFQTSGRATFTGTEDGTASNPWPTVTWSNPLADTTYRVLVGTPEVSDGFGVISCSADLASRTTTTCRIAATGSFTGTVDCVAYAVGTSPWCSPTPSDLALMQTIINRTRPAKAPCVEIDVLVAGSFIGYPSRTIGSQAPKAYATVTKYPGGL